VAPPYPTTPCPWCGPKRPVGDGAPSDALLLTVWSDRFDPVVCRHKQPFYVRCGHCGARGPTGRTATAAVLAWEDWVRPTRKEARECRA